MSAPTVAVTGSTGTLGGLVAGMLADAGVEQRLLVRTVAKAPVLPGSVVHQFAYDDREASIAALEGVETLFMVSTPEGPSRLGEHRAFIAAARDAGVRHVVYTSFLASAEDCVFTLGRDHWATEEYLKASGMNWTFLRDSFYADFMPHFIEEGDDGRGVIRGPAGDGRASIVQRVDVASSAAAVLADSAPHVNTTYGMTGPEALTMTEITATISAARGTEVTFQNETIEEAIASRASYGAPDWQMDSWISTYTSIASGEQSEVTNDVERLTGRRPGPLADLLRL